MRFLLMCLAVALCIVSRPELRAADWKAGVAKVQITPTNAMWLTGFAARTNVSSGKLQELYVKALALKDPSGNRAVLVTSDLLGFPAEISERIAGEVQKKHHLSRERILFNSSHTHGGPALASSIHFIYGPQATAEQKEDIAEYTRSLEAKVVKVIGDALSDLKPVSLNFGQGKATFGINRRKMTPHGIESFVPNPEGPADHSVPVLRVTSKRGQLMAVVFGYAAHPTAIHTGPNLYDFTGDYAGFAQEAIEKSHPGAVAMFVQGCGGDIMVYPRGTVGLARQYGEQLSAAVNEVLKAPMHSVQGKMKARFAKVPVEFAPPPNREQLQKQLATGDLYHRWHAQEMLKKLDQTPLPTSYPYPIQAWQLGDNLTLVALAGEVVVDYSLRLKKELGGNTLWVAGYSNDVFAYIPTRRVLEEGGYEGAGAMVYYMQPGPFAPSVEETIITQTHQLVKSVRQK